MTNTTDSNHEAVRKYEVDFAYYQGQCQIWLSAPWIIRRLFLRAPYRSAGAVEFLRRNNCGDPLKMAEHNYWEKQESAAKAQRESLMHCAKS